MRLDGWSQADKSLHVCFETRPIGARTGVNGNRVRGDLQG